MIRKIAILASVVVFGFSCVAFGGGITGGTTRDTTKQQREMTQDRMDTRQQREGVSEDKALGWVEKLGNYVYPGMGTTTEKLLKGARWTGEKQREAGGVTGTGSTAKEK